MKTLLRLGKLLFFWLLVQTAQPQTAQPADSATLPAPYVPYRLSPDGKWLLTITGTGLKPGREVAYHDFTLWALPEMKNVGSIKAGGGLTMAGGTTIGVVDFSPDSSCLIFWSTNAVRRVLVPAHASAAGELITEVVLFASPTQQSILGFAVSSGGRYVALSTEQSHWPAKTSDVFLRVIDMTNQREIHPFQEVKGIGGRLAFLGRSHRLAIVEQTGVAAKRLSIWDVESGKKLASIPAPKATGRVDLLVSNAQGDVLFSQGPSGRLLRWGVGGEPSVTPLAVGSENGCFGAFFSPKEKRAVIYGGIELYLVDTNTGKLLANAIDNGGFVGGVAFDEAQNVFLNLSQAKDASHRLHRWAAADLAPLVPGQQPVLDPWANNLVPWLNAWEAGSKAARKASAKKKVHSPLTGAVAYFDPSQKRPLGPTLDGIPDPVRPYLAASPANARYLVSVEEREVLVERATYSRKGGAPILAEATLESFQTEWRALVVDLATPANSIMSGWLTGGKPQALPKEMAIWQGPLNPLPSNYHGTDPLQKLEAFLKSVSQP